MPKTRRPQAFLGKNYLRFISILLAMGAIGLLCSVLFNFHPYPKFITDWYRFLDFRQGIAVEAQTNLKVGDTNIITYNKDGDSIVSVQPAAFDATKSIQSQPSTGRENNSIFVHRRFVTKKAEVVKDVRVTGMQIHRAELYLQTDRFWYRLYFSFPLILTFIAASYSFWLLAGLVSDIQAGLSFGKANWKRLQNIGGAVLTVQVVYLIMDLFLPLLGRFSIAVTNTIAGYQSNFEFKADPALPVNPTWILIGILVLTLARAFRDGEVLQEDKESIV